MQYSIDDVKKLFNDRAGTRGVSSNVSPDKFNRWFNSAELKFFNQRYDDYARRQTISDSISKWMSDPMIIPVAANGFFNFFLNMNLLHVDSMSNYLPVIGTSIATLNTLVGGTLYTDGSYNQTPLTGGTGTGATAYIVIQGGIVVSVIPQQQGTGYAVNDTLSADLPVGSEFTIDVATLTGATKDNPVTRVEKQLWAANTSSTYDAPSQQFPIYTQFATSFQFAPNIGFAKIIYLQQPIWSKWEYTLNGYIATLTGLEGGEDYTDGTYTNVPLVGTSIGNGALATFLISGNVVTSVTLTNPGKLYQNTEVLQVDPANVGGTGDSFQITVSSLVPGSIRPVYDAGNSIQPRWNNDDISTIIDLALADAAIAGRDKELTAFANDTSKQLQ